MSDSSSHNLYLYDASNGNMIADKLLKTNDIDDKSAINFRGIYLYNRKLYVANANSNSSESYIGVWSCANETDVVMKGMPFDSYFSVYDKSTNKGLLTPYDISIDETKSVEDGFMYVAARDSESILLYDDNGDPDTKADGLHGSYPGAIASYSSSSSTSDGIGGITIDNDIGLLFVSETSLNIILVYDINNKFENIYNITNGKTTFLPGVIAYNNTYDDNILFVSDSDSSRIYSFNVSKNGYLLNWESQKTNQLNNPTGIAIGPSSLFVVSKDDFKIVKFDAATGDFEKELVYFDQDLFGEMLIFVANGECFEVN